MEISCCVGTGNPLSFIYRFVHGHDPLLPAPIRAVCPAPIRRRAGSRPSPRRACPGGVPGANRGTRRRTRRTLARPRRRGRMQREEDPNQCGGLRDNARRPSQPRSKPTAQNGAFRVPRLRRHRQSRRPGTAFHRLVALSLHPPSRTAPLEPDAGTRLCRGGPHARERLPRLPREGGPFVHIRG